MIEDEFYEFLSTKFDYNSKSNIDMFISKENGIIAKIISKMINPIEERSINKNERFKLYVKNTWIPEF